MVKSHHRVIVVEISGYYNARYLKDLRVNRVRLESDISDVLLVQAASTSTDGFDKNSRIYSSS